MEKCVKKFPRNSKMWELNGQFFYIHPAVDKSLIIKGIILSDTE